MNNYDSIDILCTKISNSMISEEADIDSLCDNISNINIQYNEYNELKEAIEVAKFMDYCVDDSKILEFMNCCTKESVVSIVTKTQDRYIRYLTHVERWDENCISCCDLRNKIVQFINIPIVDMESIIIKLRFMKQIDIAIFKIVKENHI